MFGEGIPCSKHYLSFSLLILIELSEANISKFEIVNFDPRISVFYIMSIFWPAGDRESFTGLKSDIQYLIPSLTH